MEEMDISDVRIGHLPYKQHYSRLNMYIKAYSYADEWSIENGNDEKVYLVWV